MGAIDPLNAFHICLMALLLSATGYELYNISQTGVSEIVSNILAIIYILITIVMLVSKTLNPKTSKP